MKKEKALVTIIPQGNSPAEMIRMAVGGKADLAQLKELLAIQKDWESNEARKAYHLAMAGFKANPPKITKDKKVSYQAGTSNIHYNHASLANVIDKISAELSKHGLSASWTTKQNGVILVTCKITHIKGHSEETTLSAPADNSGAKNAIQQIGSTITYLERYTLLALTGLATYDMDDDARASVKPDVAKPEPKPSAKVLPDDIKAKFTKARKLLGKDAFDKIIGGEGYSNESEILDIKVASQILNDMGDYYNAHKE